MGLNAIVQMESAVLLWVQQNLRSDVMNIVMTGITSLNYKGIVWILVTLVLLANKRTRRLGAMCLLSMLIGLVVANGIVKVLVARPRPYDVIQGLNNLTVEKDFSFPSGHTTNAFACAWVLFRRGPKRWGVPALVLAILIALSRIYVGVHFPTDVLGGVAIGICSAALAMWALPKIEQRFPKVKRLIREK